MRSILFGACFNFFLMITVCQALSQTAYVWWEGENPVQTNFPKTTWFNTGALEGKRDLLSAGDWLSNDGKRSGEAAFAQYSVEIPQAGEYRFWVRKFWKHGPFEWRFNNQEWRVCLRDVALADSVAIQQHISANWVFLGSVELPQGAAAFELRLLADEGESLTACFDCFLLTQSLFLPRGKWKPNEKSGEADEGFFSWEPPLDSFSQDALLDLRYLNESAAGVHGFVRREGDHFTLGDASPVRFWAVNLSSEIAALDRPSIDYLARKLAKTGVNMVRYHSPIFDSTNPDRVDEQKLDNLFYLINTLKKNGVYTTISFYFPLWFQIRTDYGIPGYESIDNKRPFALLYFDPRMQEIYKSWAKTLLTTQNPYTGESLSNEPAVAIVEIINEDSYFFWTFTKSNIPSVQWAKLEKRFGDWLIDRYGSLENAYSRWDGKKEAGDDPENGRIALYEAWSMTGGSVRSQSASTVKRIGDQVRFLTEQQRSFYADMKTYFTEDLGCRSLISASNWQVSDPNMLDALERYTYTACDVIDRHGYFSGEHQSADGSHSYSVAPGHTFKNLAAVSVPERLPLQFIQVSEHPHIISEIGWTNPNLYRADYSFLAAAYGSLQGIDGFYAFALGGAFWDADMKKFALSCPVILGNFPAYALMYRRGDIQVGEPVLHQILDLEDLYAMKGSGGSAAQALDDLRLQDIPPGGEVSGEVNNIDPLSFFVGRVMRSFGVNTDDSTQMNLSKYIDRENRIVTSRTGELIWNYGSGLATLHTPKSEGAAGFLQQAGRIQIGAAAIESQNEYGSIVLVTLDDQPIQHSNKILIQAMTIERPYGFRASNGKDGTITDMGGYPFGVEKIQATISLQWSGANTAQLTPLDENGYPADAPAIIQRQNSDQPFVFSLKENAVYHILQRSSNTNVIHWPLCEIRQEERRKTAS
ncbi:MAG: hypothetical protein JXR73_11135 [Candidatus Omnitrophica bacterium]|nr:hypothetical protein [Candidatus Omnitrophota bacterium]